MRTRLAAALAAAALVAVTLPATALAGDNDHRTNGPTYGLGLGLTVPSASLAPTVGSLRVRFNDDFTLEPVVGFAGGKEDTDGGADTEATTLSFGTQARYRFADKGKVDGLVVGGAGYGALNTTVDPKGGDDQIDNSSAIYVNAGLGLDYWLHPHWTLSFDGSLVGYVTGSHEYGGKNTSTDESSAYSITTAPALRFMVHCYL